MIVTNRILRISYGYIICILCFISCMPQKVNNIVVEETRVEERSVAPMPTSMPRPQFIRAISPIELAILPIHLYRSATDERVIGVKGYPIGFPDPQQGYNSQICVELDFAPPVAQKGDNLTDINTLSRLFVFVDNQNRTLIQDIYIKTGLEEEITVSEDGLTQWVSPWTFCWEAELEVGIHEVEFQFHQTSGDILSYTWYFELTE